MIEMKIQLKNLNDIDVKLMLCKSNFQWKLLAEKYEETTKDIEKVYGENMPKEIEDTIIRVRAKLVEKKTELPPEDLLV